MSDLYLYYPIDDRVLHLLAIESAFAH
jgi:hypothetical protein